MAFYGVRHPVGSHECPALAAQGVAAGPLHTTGINNLGSAGIKNGCQRDNEDR